MATKFLFSYWVIIGIVSLLLLIVELLLLTYFGYITYNP
jgi:hypothetical protein